MHETGWQTVARDITMFSHNNKNSPRILWIKITENKSINTLKELRFKTCVSKSLNTNTILLCVHYLLRMCTLLAQNVYNTCSEVLCCGHFSGSRHNSLLLPVYFVGPGETSGRPGKFTRSQHNCASCKHMSVLSRYARSVCKCTVSYTNQIHSPN